MTELKNMDDAIMSLNENDLLYDAMYGNKSFNNNMNMSILTATTKFIHGVNSMIYPWFIKVSERFDVPLF